MKVEASANMSLSLDKTIQVDLQNSMNYKTEEWEDEIKYF